MQRFGNIRGSRPIGDRPLTQYEKVKRWNAKNPGYKKGWRTKNPEKYKLEKRKQHLKAYGLTPETYEAMWIAQDYKCAICKSPDPFSKKGWQVDHCHSTGNARGILCTHCNRMLAGALDNISNLLNGIEYLRKQMQ